ncbi:spermidine synthase [Roseiarcus fermentans]|uniref:Spermidine synthase n=1 Tax=Roseiarcus fermentans TaxID=1473586 RepID=A0A366ENQ7_9HYPH|nr:spermidine synthase [Roseiarcus fermentans]RBP04052.1 spermidine synthase [Roseiarcus fermentans]
MGSQDEHAATIVERAAGRFGELALRSVGGHYEIVMNGVFLMDTRNGESERLLVRLALRDAPDHSRLMIGGLGVGFSLAEALRSDRLGRATVVEIEPRIVAWCRTHLAPFSQGALADPRVEIVEDDVAAFLRRSAACFDAICLDVDNGPAWTVADANGALYAAEGLAMLRDRLKPGGTLTVWSAAAAPTFEARLRDVFDAVEAVAVPVARGEPDVVYVASRSRA